MATTALTPIFDSIETERRYQDGKWGIAFDDKNTINDWATYVGVYLAKATAMGAAPETQRAQLVKVASIACAALEAYARNDGFPPRHYD